MPMAQNLSKELDALPIPPATLVIDMRDAGDEVLETLKSEIYNLFHEMSMEQVDHWRYLTDFIAFKAISPLTLEDVEMLRETEQKYVEQKRSIAGRYHPGMSKHGPDKYYKDEDDTPSLLEAIPHDEFKRNLAECKALINTVRNRRFEAVRDMSNTGRISGHKANSKVQVIMITDEQSVDTLASASAYAAHLKKMYGGSEETGFPMLDTMIICLNHDNQAEPPKRLINMFRWENIDKAQSDEWQHIDALYLIECYGHNGVYISPGMQPDIAELLIYAFLLAPPRPMRPPEPKMDTLLLPPPKHKLKESKSLPSKTYVVGLSAIEHSARWGRHFLNYGLAAEAVSILQEKQTDDQATVNHTVDAWLRRWRLNVRVAVPDQISGEVPTLQQAFSRCEQAAASSDKITTVSNLTLDIGDKTARRIEQYVDAVGKTYTMSLGEQEVVWKETQKNSSGQVTQEGLTLQDALNSTNQIQQQIDKWQEGDPETPLIKARKEAQRVFSHPDFFKEPRGAVPRAKLQLGELSKLIRGFQNEHKKETVNLDQRRKELVQLGQDKIKEVEVYATRFPFFAGFLRLKSVIAWLTLILVAALGVIAVIIGLAWFHHLLITLPDFSGLMAGLDRYGLLSASFYTLIVWVITLVVVVIIILAARKIVFDRKRSALWVEVYFLAALIAFPVLGWIVSLSAGLNNVDPTSYMYFIWLSRLPFWSTVILFIALFILLVEAIYYFIWHNGLVNERKRIVRAIRDHQSDTVNRVKEYLADEVALAMLRSAGLTDGSGNPGQYYYRIDQLYSKLEDLFRATEKEHRIAKHHLLPQEKLARGATNSTKTPPVEIRIRVPESSQLIASSKRLRNEVVDESEELTDFAELMLRVMGEEEPILIEQQLNERPITIQTLGQQSFQSNSEQREAQLLLSTVVSLSLRAAISQLKAGSIAPLAERYSDLDYRVADQFSGLKSLLDLLQAEVGKDSLTLLDDVDDDHKTKSKHDLSSDETSLPVYALEVWSQTLWEQKDPEVDKLLDSGGLVQYLERNQYDPQTVKSLLGASTIISGRPRNVGQLGELYFLLYPSRQGRSFFEDMELESRFVGIPDAERLILLYIHQYVALPILITEAEEEADINAASGTEGQNGHVTQDTNTGKATGQSSGN